ncbi:helix-turn-helix domain-containing protein [Halobaculum rubrum]|uniref:helix-turn-helix domain-containing protein n=1 Tax=Halobaculum rubrum TaxID=2872158 RepID=UPI001CA3FE4C|nr:helix-turn-helix domain-containing protein [Halobaculum rubrum]QZX99137.1 helix-turn-helix domain-containing protein [Halobaculum rubrum]
MSVHATVAVAPREFALSRTLTVAGDARIELERVIPLEGRLAPYLTVTAADPARVCDLVAAEPAVADVEAVHRGDDQWVLCVRWGERHSPMLAALVDADVACTEAVEAHGTWHLTLRFHSHEALADWYHRCLERGVRPTVERVRDGSGGGGSSESPALTSAQREALATAYESGYFAVPRKVTLAELAERLEISDTATSQRLRRGMQNMLADVFAARTVDR